MCWTDDLVKTMTADQPKPLVPEASGPPATVAVAVVVALAQVVAFYVAIRAIASFALPVRRGVILLGVLLVAAAVASLGARRIAPHRGSGYAIPLFATGGFVAGFSVAMAAGLRLVGPVVLVPGGIGSFLGVVAAMQWWSRPHVSAGSVESAEAHMTNEFTAVVERDGEWFIAYCAEVPGANGQGRTKEEALASLSHAVAMILEDRREDSLRGLPPDAVQEKVTIK
jgi:predicted RNase H-like HicB family nuclease